MEKVFIKDLTVGEQVIGFYLVKSKRNKFTRAGKLFLDLDLVDRTGAINAKVWEGADRASLLFKRGDVVKVMARVEEYQGRRQLKIEKIRTLAEDDEFDWADVIKTTPLDVDEMTGWLRARAEELEDEYLKALVFAFLDDDDFMNAFTHSAAARNLHHVYAGGLVEHTVKVIKLVMFAADELYPGQVDRDLLFAGSLLHDAGKIKELSLGPEFNYTTEGYLRGHVIIGSQMLRERVSAIEGFPEELLLELEHILVSHHGEREWGSPVVPMTPEAMMIHCADNLDAKTQIALSSIAEDPNVDEDFTEYHRTLGRHFYKRPDRFGSASGSEEEDSG